MTVYFRRFLLVGLTAVGLDFSVYSVCHHIFELSFALSKAFSYFSGTLFSFYFNGKWTFSKNLSLNIFLKHFLTYLFTLCLNVICNSLFLEVFGKRQFLNILLAFGFATLVSTICNFIIMRKWVFN